MTSSSRHAGYLLALWLCALSLPTIGADTGLLVTDEDVVNTGHIVYQSHCAVCHGPTGRGDGPFAPLLHATPADLSRLAARNGGELPFWRVYETISGSELLPAHGTREMPIWGEALARESTTTALDPVTYTRGRIFNLLAWLRVIQREQSTP